MLICITELVCCLWSGWPSERYSCLTWLWPSLLLLGNNHLFSHGCIRSEICYWLCTWMGWSHYRTCLCRKFGCLRREHLSRSSRYRQIFPESLRNRRLGLFLVPQSKYRIHIPNGPYAGLLADFQFLIGHELGWHCRRCESSTESRSFYSQIRLEFRHPWRPWYLIPLQQCLSRLNRQYWQSPNFESYHRDRRRFLLSVPAYCSYRLNLHRQQSDW